jgi:hypothetical protein
LPPRGCECERHRTRHCGRVGRYRGRLAVAIPALFGYNYLQSQVKDATSDMHIFIDEFVTKIAEYYGGRGRNGSGNRPTDADRAELEMIA